MNIMIKEIYHGSSCIIRSPGFGAGSAGNDFGLGLYCTADIDMAREWGSGRTANGFVNKYRLETTGLRIIDLTSPQFCVLHWLSVLLAYRQFDIPSSMSYQAGDYIRTAFGVDYQNCDCIAGWRADDCYFSFAQDFLSGEISYEQLRDAVTPGTLGQQFVLKSNRAFGRISFSGYEPARSRENYPRFAAREQRAMRDYMRMRASLPRDEGGLYVDRIVQEEIMPYDARLR